MKAPNNRVKYTKTQILGELRADNPKYATSNAYDLNESGGFIADKRIRK